MTERKELGKITAAEIGEVDGRIGIWFTFNGNAWGVGDTSHWWWSDRIAVTSSTKWTETDRQAAKADAMTFLGRILNEAKVQYLHQLEGKPVEVMFDGMTMTSWRILTEVL